MDFQFYNRMLTNLDQLSHVTYGQKIIVNEGFISNDTSSMQSIARKISGQGRGASVKAVQEIVYSAMEFCKVLYEFMVMSKYMKDYKSDEIERVVREKNTMYKKLYTHLEDSDRGISALIGTYSSDTATRSQLEKMQADIKKFLTDNNLEKNDPSK